MNQYIKICAKHGTLIQLNVDDVLPNPMPLCVACADEIKIAKERIMSDSGKFPIMLPTTDVTPPDIDNDDPALFIQKQQRSSLIAAGCPEYIPWTLVEKFKSRLQPSYNQDLMQVYNRGGLGIVEVIHLLQGPSEPHCDGISDIELVPYLLELLAANVS